MVVAGCCGASRAATAGLSTILLLFSAAQASPGPSDRLGSMRLSPTSGVGGGANSGTTGAARGSPASQPASRGGTDLWSINNGSERSFRVASCSNSALAAGRCWGPMNNEQSVDEQSACVGEKMDMDDELINSLTASFDKIIRSIAGDVTSLKALASVRFDVEKLDLLQEKRNPSSLPSTLSSLSSLIASLNARCDDLSAVIAEETAAVAELEATRESSLAVLAAVEALKAQAPDGKLASLCASRGGGSRTIVSSAPVLAPPLSVLPPAPPPAARSSLGPSAARSSLGPSAPAAPAAPAAFPQQPRPLLETEYNRLPLSIRSRLSLSSLSAAYREIFLLQQTGVAGVKAVDVKSRCDFFKGGDAHGNLVVSSLRQLNRIKTKGTLTLTNNGNDGVVYVST